jgi:hypothetical protein
MHETFRAVRAGLALCALCAAATAQFAVAPDERLFPTPTGAPLGDPRRFTFTDLDGDGDVDGYDFFYGQVRYGDGNGRFGPGAPVSQTVFTQTPEVVELGDFDGDGTVDAVCGLQSGVGLYRTLTANQVTTTFVASFPGQPVEAVAGGDLDGDGDLDVVVSRLVGAPRVFLNDGVGGFAAAPPSWTLPVARYRSIDLVDLDADGLADLLGARIDTNAPTGNTVAAPVLAFEALRNVGGGFAPPVVLVAPAGFASQAMNPVRDYVADFDGDGLADVVTPDGADAVSLRLQTAGFAFVQSATIAAPGGGVRVAALRNAAGAPAALICGRTGHVAARYVGGTFAQTGAGPETALHVYRADVDGDGDEDAVCAEPGPLPWQYRVLFATTADGFVAEDSGTPWRFAYSAASLGDADGDGDLDLLAYAGTLDVRGPVVALNDGRGTFGVPTAEPCVGCPAAPSGNLQPDTPRVLARDLDGDGDADLLVHSVWGLFALRNDGAAGFTSIWNAPEGVSATGFACADFNGDGLDDVAYAIGTPVASAVRIATGYPFGFGFGAPSTILTSAPGYAGSVAATDADDDGDLDVVAWAKVPGGNPLGGQYLTPNLGGGVFGAPSVVYSPANAGDSGARWSAVTADLDGDGDEDFLFGGNRLVFRTGPAAFSAPTSLPSGPPFAVGAFAAADFEGDGDLDLVGTIGALLNAGDGTFGTAASAFYGAVAAWADVDGDGDADAVSNAGLVQSNRTRDLAAYYPLRPGRPVLFGVFGAPGAAYLLAVDAGLSAPLATPFGPLWLDPATALVVAVGTLPVDGPALVSATLPANPALVGLAAAFQAAVDEPLGPRLTDVRALTVRGY